MTIIGHCPHCHDVRLRIRHLTVRVCLPTNERTCTFPCPKCGRGCARELNDDKADRLIRAGVKVVFWRYPLEMYERHDGPVLTLDDLIELHGLLADDAWCARLGTR